jgi:F0F1-type ATP synthase assembly protein I
MPSPLNGGAEGARMWRVAGLFMASGIEMAICVGLPTWGGQLLDDRYNWAPWGSLIGFGIGVGAAITGLLRSVRAARRILAQPPKEPPA